MDSMTQNQQAGELFTTLLTTCVSRMELVEKLDLAIWDLTRYQLEDENFSGGVGGADTIHFLRYIKDVCLLKPVNNYS